MRPTSPPEIRWTMTMTETKAKLLIPPPSLPTTAHTVCLLMLYNVVVLQHIQTLSDATFLCLSVARAIEHAHRNQSGRNSIHCSLQANRMASDNIPLCSFISFISASFLQHAGDPAGYNRQFNWVCLLAQSVHLHLHTHHTEH